MRELIEYVMKRSDNSGVKRNDAAWKEVFGARDEDVRERCSEFCKRGKKKVKRCTYQSKKKVHEQEDESRCEWK